MKNRTITLVFALLLAAGAAILAYRVLRPEPLFYGGKSLSYWAREFRSGGARRNRAEDAFRAAGSNAVPFLIVALNGKESPLRRQLTVWAWKLPPLRWFFPAPGEAPEFLRARVGVVLADIAAPADTNTVAALRKALDDPFHGARNNAIVALAKTAPRTTAARQAVAALIYATKDQNIIARGNAYFSLRYFAPDAVEAIPVLQRGLEDPEIYVRRSATNGLEPFLRGPEAAQKPSVELPSSEPGAELALLRAQLRELQDKYTDDYPLIPVTKRRIEELEKQEGATRGR